ncbi:MAG: hypothetical protein C4539_02330 [Ignavibacteriales bacterium]|nr:MAG: hypothetical protein C4539_02330 [Ignavibacteriales bacterium]
MKKATGFFCVAFILSFIACSKDNPVTNQLLEIKWEQLLNNRNVTGIAFNSRGDIYVSVYEAGIGNKIFYSKDIVIWDSANITLAKNENVKALYVNESGEIFIAGHDGMQCNLYCSKDDGKTWANISPEHKSDFKRILSVGNKLFISSIFHDESPGGIYYTTNYGENWTTSFWQRNKGNGSLILLSDNTLMDVRSDSLLVSADEGQSWTLKKGIIDSAYIRTLEADQSGNVYASTYKGVYRSGDKGTSWTKTGLSNLVISIFKSTSSGYLFASEGLVNMESPKGIYFTSDRGATWAECNDGLTDKLIQAIAVDNKGYVYAGTGTGVFRTIVPIK